MLYFAKIRVVVISIFMACICLIPLQSRAQLLPPGGNGDSPITEEQLLEYFLTTLGQNSSVDAKVLQAYQDSFWIRVLITLDSDIAPVAPSVFSQISQDGKFLSSESARTNSIQTLQQVEQGNAVSQRTALYARWATSGINISSSMELWESKYRPVFSIMVDPVTLNMMVQDGHITKVSLSSGTSTYLPETRPLTYKKTNPPITWPVFDQLIVEKSCDASASQKCTDRLGGNSVVAVIDTGVELNHPFFEKPVLGGIEYRVLDGICTSKTLSPSAYEQYLSVCGSSPEIAKGDACTVEGCSHGTAVAGIIAGRNSQYEGIAPDAHILPIQAASISSIFVCLDTYDVNNPPELTEVKKPSIDCVQPGWAPARARISTEAYIDALEYVYQKSVNGFPAIGDGSLRITVVNLSNGYKSGLHPCDSSNILYNTIQQLVNADIAVVAASGNEGNKSMISSPACLPGVISVGAMYDGSSASNGDVNAKNTVHLDSNSSADLDFLAPAYYTTTSVRNGHYTNYFAGTSAAAPHISGAIAVVKGRFPEMSINAIKQMLSGKLGPKASYVTDTANDEVTPVVKLGVTLYELCKGYTQPSTPPGNRLDICESNVQGGPLY